MSTYTSVSQVVQEAADRYPIAHDAAEIDRLRNQHEWLRDSIADLILAPIDLSKPHLRILDSATADGYWLVDLASSGGLSDDNVYIGTDIAPHLFPSDLPSSITLSTQSIMAPWPADWNSSFDLVHQRLVLAACSPDDAKHAVGRLVELVKPGGWIQLVEADMNPHLEPDDKARYPSMARFVEMTQHLMTLAGLNSQPGLGLKPWLHAAGVEELVERKFNLPLGSKSELAVKGMQNMKAIVRNFREMAMRLGSAGGGVGDDVPNSSEAMTAQMSCTADDFDKLQHDLEKEWASVGGWSRLHVVYGRRPLGEGL